MNMKRVPVCSQEAPVSWPRRPHLGTLRPTGDNISKPISMRKGLENQIHTWHFDPRKGKGLCTLQAKRNLVSYTGNNSFLREEERWPRHIKPACANILKMEGGWCLRLAEAAEARAEGAVVERSEVEWEGGWANPEEEALYTMFKWPAPDEQNMAEVEVCHFWDSVIRNTPA